MASSDRTTRLTAIRDNLESELQDETLRRYNLTAAGHPPPTTYSVDGRSVDWNGYLAAMTANIKAVNEIIGASDPFEHVVTAYTG